MTATPPQTSPIASRTRSPRKTLRRALWRDRTRTAALAAALVVALIATVARLRAPLPSAIPRDGIAVQVERVVDGDTLLLADGRRVRLFGVDTPETKHPTRPPEPLGEEASAFTRTRVEGRTVRLIPDIERLDRYGRTLGWVEVDGELLNVELVRAGLSRAVLLSPLRPDFRKQLVAAEREAIDAGRGLHALPSQRVEQP